MGKKKLLSFLTAGTVFLSTLMGCNVNTPASTDGTKFERDMSGECGDNLHFEYTMKDGLLKITGKGEMTSCPWSGYGGVTVKAVSFEEGITSIYHGAFYAQSELSGDVVLPDSLTYIDDFSFYGTKALNSVKLSPNTTYLGDYAFRQSGITKIELPDTITYIGEECFDSCESLKGELKLPASLEKIGRCAFSHCTGLTGDLIIPDSVTEIGDYAFSDCTGFDGNLVISKNLKEIKECCFSADEGFKGDLVIPDNVKIIGRQAFYNGGFDGNLILPSEMESIEEAAFEYCRKLKGEVTIPKGIGIVEKEMFIGCESIEKVNFNDDIRYICNEAFCNCSSLKSLSLPGNLRGIGNNAFRGCKSIKGELIFPDSVVYIESGAFMECSMLTGEIKIPEGTLAIEDYSFAFMEGISGKVTIPDSVKVIGNSAFCGCKNISEAEIGRSVTSIGKNAFKACDSLKSVKLLSAEIIPDYYDNTEEEKSFPEGCEISKEPGAVKVDTLYSNLQKELEKKEKDSIGGADSADANEEVPYLWTDALISDSYIGYGPNYDTKIRFDETNVFISINEREEVSYKYSADANSEKQDIETDKIWYKGGYLCDFSLVNGPRTRAVKAVFVNAEGLREDTYFPVDVSYTDAGIDMDISLEKGTLFERE